MVRKLLHVFMVLSVITVSAQELPEIKVVAKSFGDSIALRWAANTPLSWKLCNQYGYRITRYTVSRGDQLLPERTKGVVIAEKVTPKAEEFWYSIIDKNDKALIAAQAIYGERFEVNAENTGLMSMINQAREWESRFSFALLAVDQDFQVAQLSGLGYVDQNVNRNEDYVYKIASLVPDSILRISDGEYYVQTGKTLALPSPKLLSVTPGDHVAELKWDKIHYEKHFTSWIIERSDNEGKSFKKVNKNGFVQLKDQGTNQAYYFYLDSLPKNGIKYPYRIKGVTPFGEVSLPSDTLAVIGKKRLSVTPVLKRPRVLSNGMVTLSWEFPENLDSLLQGFEVFRSLDHKKGFKKMGRLLSGESRFVIDSFPYPVTYYKVYAHVRSGQVLKSQVMAAQLKDSIPPLPPNDVYANIDSTGLVKITWSGGKEGDLGGYRVFRANAMHEEFIQVTKEVVDDTVFEEVIDLDNLTPKIYYKVIAQDLHFNKSDYSEVVGIVKPDIVPPVPPVIKTVKDKGNSIELFWVNSSSKGVKENWLLRKGPRSDKWEKVFSTRNDTHFIDKNLSQGKVYEYTMCAIDSSGLTSDKSPLIKVQLKKTESIEKPVFNAKLNTEKKVITLSWEYPASEPEKVIVYRSVNDQQIRSHTTVIGEKLRFTDKDILLGSKYGYRVQYVYQDGTCSPVSDVVEVRF